MSFRVDKQTIDDLAIFGKMRDNSVYGIFNKVHTHGGSKILEKMFLQPLDKKEEINERQETIGAFQKNEIVFPYKSEFFDSAEFYLSNKDRRTRIVAHGNTLERKFKSVIGTDFNYKQIQKGIAAIIEIICITHNFLNHIEKSGIDKYCCKYTQAIGEILSMKELKEIPKIKNPKKLSFKEIANLDQTFRFSISESLNKLLVLIYTLDVYISAAKVANDNKYCAAIALDPNPNYIKITDLYHPLLDNPISNSIEINDKNNMVFLTGANMAGKSTFMKSFGIAVYLAHVGFPVPATQMSFSVQNGLFTTINLPDNLNMGYSHFYAEVMRVKKVAQSISRSNKLIVIFDELFRGTNVKDAFDATVAVTQAFAANKECIFIISTHIIEAGEVLKEGCDNINFIYLPTIMKNNLPEYTYKIKSGITEDRHGMIIINNEGIPDILKNRISKI
ncbi:MAG: DNA mismatch repair protein [Bacteroidales bacterium]